MTVSLFAALTIGVSSLPEAAGDSYWKDDQGRICFQPAYGGPVIC